MDPWMHQLDRLRAAGMTDAQIMRAIDRLIREATLRLGEKPKMPHG